VVLKTLFSQGLSRRMGNTRKLEVDVPGRAAKLLLQLASLRLALPERG
jgi:hypothetical protein